MWKSPGRRTLRCRGLVFRPGIAGLGRWRGVGGGGTAEGNVLVVDLVLDTGGSRAGEAPDGLERRYAWFPGRPEDGGSPREQPPHAVMSQNHGQEVVKSEVSIRLLAFTKQTISKARNFGRRSSSRIMSHDDVIPQKPYAASQVSGQARRWRGH